jgi:hypothetical protein
MLSRPPALPAAGEALFGPRLPWRQRLRAIGEALRYERDEIARRERPPRVDALVRLTWSRKPKVSGERSGISPWWLVWVALMVIRLVAGSH